MSKQVGLQNTDLCWFKVALISIYYREVKRWKNNIRKISSINDFKRSSCLNFDQLLYARQFHYIVEAFFQTNVLNGPLGRVKYYTIRVEFQTRRSPHIHSFLWITNAPVLTKDNIQEYINSVDGIFKTNIPGINKN